MADPQPDQQNQFFQALVNRLNEPRATNVRSVPCENYNATSDFDSWVKLFEDSIRASNSLGNDDQARFNALCIRWLPAKLEPGPTRLVYENLDQAVRADWALLKPALSEAYQDKSEEINFINNEKAWTRAGKSLRDYKNGLILRMDKYQRNLRQIRDEWEKAAVRRFRSGLEDPLLEAHILMNCVGENNNLEHAFRTACAFENTVSTLAQRGADKAISPSLASVLAIPQISSLSLEAPQISALSAQGERTEKRLEAIETSIKKNEMDNVELKAGFTEMKESIKSIKDSLSQERPFRQPAFPRPFRPFSLNRMSAQPAYHKQYPQYRAHFPRPQGPTGIIPGLTGGPGFATSQTNPNINKAQGNINPIAHNPQSSGNSQTIGGDNNQKAPMLASFEGFQGSDEVKYDTAPSANQNVQWGNVDYGYGWTDYDDDQMTYDGLYAACNEYF